ncbi:MAG: hypothetical protein WEF50_04260 [Myxococcota bacterium]
MAFADAALLKTTLLGVQPGDFVSAHLFEPIPNLFAGDLALWITWKTQLAHQLEVDPYEIVLTGSSAVGFSLNPAKNFAAFHPESDVDVAVVSAHHFDLAWRYLRRTHPSWLSLPMEAQRALKAHRNNYVFAGTIATDRILALLPFAKPWQAALDAMAKVNPTIGREVNLRVYRDYDSLRSYQVTGIERLRGALLETKADEADVLTEDA